MYLYTRKKNTIDKVTLRDGDNNVMVHVNRQQHLNKYTNGGDIENTQIVVEPYETKTVIVCDSSYDSLLDMIPNDSDVHKKGNIFETKIKYVAVKGSLLHLVSYLYDKDIAQLRRDVLTIKNEKLAIERDIEQARRRLTEMTIKNNNLLDIIYEKDKIIDGSVYKFAKKIKNIFK